MGASYIDNIIIQDTLINSLSVTEFVTLAALFITAISLLIAFSKQITEEVSLPLAILKRIAYSVGRSRYSCMYRRYM